MCNFNRMYVAYGGFKKHPDVIIMSHYSKYFYLKYVYCIVLNKLISLYLL